ncbi:MAG: NAD(P)/FAD-dependent oxidoreductase [Candidatus Binatia bacterium]
MPEAIPHVVIIGGGFGGLYAAQALKSVPVRVTLVDRRNFHLFQPLLYQVATGSLSPGDIASPLRHILRKQVNACVLMAEVTAIDVTRRRLTLSDGALSYDVLVAAGGASHHYFGHPEWSVYAPGLKTIEDATDIRRRVLLAFETAEREGDYARREGWLCFVVVGGGPTGVELAGALGEIANDTLRHDFCAIRPWDAQILLVEAGSRVLSAYAPSLSAKAQTALERLGVTVRLNTSVAGIDGNGVRLRAGDREEIVPARTVLWAAGVQAGPLAQLLAGASGAQTDRAGRVYVNPDLTLAGHPELFAIGDMAHSEQDGAPLPGLAPIAMAQGHYVAQVLAARIDGSAAPAPFRYRDKGTMATIGRGQAVAQIGRVHLSGLLAWLTWIFVHILYLIGFENRVIVLFTWAWTYITRNRGARLITGADPLPLPIAAASDPPQRARVAGRR